MKFCLRTLSIAILAASLRSVAEEPSRPTSASTAATLKRLVLSFPNASTAPKLDGKADDECWRKIRGTRVRMKNGKENSITVEIKTCKVGDTAYLLLTYPWSGKIDKGSRWSWDPVRHAYFLTARQESALALIFSKPSKSANLADVWIWRFARNDSASFADDMWTKSALKWDRNTLKMDNGSPAWFSRYFAEYAGAELPRFYSRTPSGSAGNVKGRSSLKNGMAVVEFARKLKTWHKDDIDLEPECSLSLVLIRAESESRRVFSPFRKTGALSP